MRKLGDLDLETRRNSLVASCLPSGLTTAMGDVAPLSSLDVEPVD